MHSKTMPELSRQERIDLKLSRAFRRVPPRTNRLLIRLTNGRVGSRKRGIPIGLLTTTGRRSQKPRTVPVMYLADGDRFFVVASNGGDDRPPAWLLNLETTPEARFEHGGRRQPVRGRIVGSDERRELWPRLVDHNSLWAAYQTYTDRDIAVVSLDTTGAEQGSMVAIERSAVVPLPLDAAWEAFFGNGMQNWVALSDAVAEVRDYRMREDGTPEYLMVNRMGPLRASHRSDYVVYDPPTRAEDDTLDSSLGGRWVTLHEPVDGGTRVTHRFHVEPHGVMKLLFPLIRPIFERNFQRDLDQMVERIRTQRPIDEEHR